jgi:hypothetical protein
MSTAAVRFDDLTPEQRKQLGLPSPSKAKFTAEAVRSWALKTRAAMAALSRDERERVLKHALKINRV